MPCVVIVRVLAGASAPDSCVALLARRSFPTDLERIPYDEPIHPPAAQAERSHSGGAGGFVSASGSARKRRLRSTAEPACQRRGRRPTGPEAPCAAAHGPAHHADIHRRRGSAVPEPSLDRL